MPERLEIPREMKIRPAEERDRDRIRQILVATTRFSEEEVGWAMDLVDQSFDRPFDRSNRGEYLVSVLEEPDSGPKRSVQGYVCYGPTPKTEGVFDLYWIAVDPARQGQGFGQLLLRFVENEVRRQSGRMILIETRSRTSNDPTVQFYRRSGYQEVTRIKDFYRIESDKLVFCKKLGTS